MAENEGKTPDQAQSEVSESMRVAELEPHQAGVEQTRETESSEPGISSSTHGLRRKSDDVPKPFFQRLETAKAVMHMPPENPSDDRIPQIQFHPARDDDRHQSRRQMTDPRRKGNEGLEDSQKGVSVPFHERLTHSRRTMNHTIQGSLVEPRARDSDQREAPQREGHQRKGGSSRDTAASVGEAGSQTGAETRPPVPFFERYARAKASMNAKSPLDRPRRTHDFRSLFNPPREDSEQSNIAGTMQTNGYDKIYGVPKNESVDEKQQSQPEYYSTFGQEIDQERHSQQSNTQSNRSDEFGDPHLGEEVIPTNSLDLAHQSTVFPNMSIEMPASDDIGQSVARTATDGGETRPVARLKADGHYRPEYFRFYHKHMMSTKRNRLRAWERQGGRDKNPTPDDWREVLTRLHEQTPSSNEIFVKKMETVHFPEGTVATFKHSASTAILEIMQKTGSHVQVLGSSSHWDWGNRPFRAVTLFGSRQSNNRALGLLPDHLELWSADDPETGKIFGVNSLRVSREDPYRDSRVPWSNTNDPSISKDDDDLSVLEIEGLEAAVGELTATSDAREVPIRATWMENRVHKRNHTAAFLRGNAKKSTLAISQYVSDITEAVPEMVARKLSPLISSGHVQFNTKRILTMFEHPEIVANIASSSVTRVINYLLKYRKWPEFRKIYSHLQDGGYTLDASNFNAVLGAATRFGDLRNFKFTLDEMTGLEVVPTPETWALFHELMCQRFPDEAEIVLEAIRRRSFLQDNETAHRVVKNTVEMELTQHLAEHGDVASVFHHFDRRFSKLVGRTDFNWLTTNVAKPIIQLFLALGKRQEALDVLKELKVRGQGRVVVDTGIMTTFLASSLRQRDPESAIAFLRLFRVGEHGALTPEVVTYNTLFLIAWRRRYWNMLRVVWRYACAAGHTTFSMRSRMSRSILTFKPNRKGPNGLQTRGAIWFPWAAKFAVGISTGRAKCRSTSQPQAELGSGDASRLFERLPQYAYDEEAAEVAHTERKNALKRLLADDFNEVMSSRPVESFTDLLEAAWLKDLEWKAEGLGLPQGYLEKENMFREMMERGIQVPMVAGDFTKTTVRWELPEELAKA